ncbi:MULTISPECIES: nucleoside-diphosphate sugar epimerase/dehydratase [unclassified Flavobacterium]|uniref:polysaccharide biosynthesis protein n=1 Tax=unclassified Flavobacterium TaxID=196869 RepID=UPI001F1469DB|nr:MULTISPECIES: nucleoside-diphosphate sugar epimerase/dehydratase [unclassified Flavobacterium]UMY65820.1 polysaccharide biosynthesis protein [Flavobacterium sp. HJ-32-4]
MFRLLKRFRATEIPKNLSYLPRWIILAIDMSITIFSAIVTSKMLGEMGLIAYHGPLRHVVAFLFVFSTLAFFWLFRTYSGIIRHSSYIDAVKIFVALFLNTFTLIIINEIFYWLEGHKLFMNAALFINFIFTFCALFVYRIVVKQTFEIYFSEVRADELIRALIYGSDANAIAVANALKSEKPVRFRIVGFADRHGQNAYKRVLNLPILNVSKRIPVIMRSIEAEALIIADKSITKEEQLAIVDECLEYNYKVYTVPLISDWADSKEISKKVKNFQIQDLLERTPIVLDNKLISHHLNGKTVLISGAAGSIGSEIVRQVLSFEPRKVVLLDQAETPLHNLLLEIRKNDWQCDIIPAIADIRDRATLTTLFELHQPDVVFHAAAYKHVPLMEDNPAQAVLVNVMGTKNIADMAYRFRAESFVMVSTDKAVNPSNVMGASKRIAEKYVQALHHTPDAGDGRATRFITTRFGNVLGSNGSVVPLFTEQIAKGGPLTITHPEIIRYFMTIQEACQLVLEAGAMGNGGEIFIFDMGKPVKIIDLAHKMIRLAGYVPGKEIKIEIVGLRPGEKMFEELLNDKALTMPTHHEKIMIAKEEKESTGSVVTAIEELVETAPSLSSTEIVSRMKALVPEYRSMNSYFEMLD